MSDRQYSNQRKPGREHWPLYPKGFIGLRIVQLVLAILDLGLSAYCAAAFGAVNLYLDGINLTLFAAIATMVVTIYLLVVQYNAPQSYNYWAVLALDIFLLVFWLIAFALLATETYIVSAYYYSCVSGLCYVTELGEGIVAAAAGVGGVQFALFIVSLVIHSVMVHRHRKAGLHCRPLHSSHHHETQSAIPLGTTTNPAEKHASQTHSQPYSQAQPAAPSYGQQAQPIYASTPTPPAAAYSSPPQQYQPQQHQQSMPSPLSHQPTGASAQNFSPYPTQNSGPPYEAPVQQPNQGPYEAHH
ncbi:hypothetical protein E8E14_013212 [Neopestalotiopsis sp. 37M]|nr:hypothetical protein E8E14_013212 [Neopestalotiopsis sp. 37M]